MQLIKNIKWTLTKYKMRAYLRRKHGGKIGIAYTVATMAFIYAPIMEAALYTF